MAAAVRATPSSSPSPSSEPSLTAPAIDVPALVGSARAGTSRAIGRLLTLVENDHPALAEVAAELGPAAGEAHVVGLTGAPGVGKSTTTNALVGELRRRGRTVAVLAVDPSSPFSGGALLGDRIRMTEHSLDPGVFIRSMATRGHLGGLAAAAPQAVRILGGVGFEIVLVETVGVGQSEVEIAGLADSTVVLLAPGLGDGIQAAKAGILEIGDVFVVNKADRPGAGDTARDLRHMLTMGQRRDPDWRRPVLTAVAQRGDGIPALADALEAHRTHLAATGELHARRLERARAEVLALALAEVHRALLAPGGSLEGIAARVVAGDLTPHAAAEELVAEARRSGRSTPAP